MLHFSTVREKHVLTAEHHTHYNAGTSCRTIVMEVIA